MSIFDYQATKYIHNMLTGAVRKWTKVIFSGYSLRARAGSKRRRGAANRDHEDSLKRDSTMTCLAVKTSV
uniref:Uncharacterized protein n=1 Tax=Aegilops tauschii subsp. strangulata TaxID=200361 RepID=A0A453RGH3_AEGTS